MFEAVKRIKVVGPSARFVWRKLKNATAWCSFAQDYRRFRSMTDKTQRRFGLQWRDRFPCLHDRSATTEFGRHYVYHTAWAARVIARIRPELHTDISSSLFFCSIVSAFAPIRFYDIRVPHLYLDNLTCAHGDLMALPFEDGSVRSLSCLHTLEHIGLGRYGDPLDPDGDRKAMAELRRVLAPGGDLLVVVPVGKPLIMFNAHRIYSYQQIIDEFKDYRLMEFALIPDPHQTFVDPRESRMVVNAPPELVDLQKYGCGCFWFQKNAVA